MDDKIKNLSEVTSWSGYGSNVRRFSKILLYIASGRSTSRVRRAPSSDQAETEPITPDHQLIDIWMDKGYSTERLRQRASFMYRELRLTIVANDCLARIVIRARTLCFLSGRCCIQLRRFMSITQCLPK